MSREKTANRIAAQGGQRALSGSPAALSTAAVLPEELDRSAAERSFAPALIAWQRQHGRHDLPWQNTRDAYRIWLSEVMLQQTQVASVIPYYQRFLQKFPDHAALAAAPLDEVLANWAGLGYYARARNLHRCAQLVESDCGGRFPTRVEALASLPGIGRSTAAAIAVFAAGARAAILDGNVKRVLTRCFGIAGFPGSAPVERELWALAERLLPETEVEAYTQGLMDLGASLCGRRKPNCPACPLASFCVARRDRRTTELPTPKPRRTIPLRHGRVLLLVHQGRVLLSARPPVGLWGGLWTLPEVAESSGPEAAARQLGCVVGDWEVLPPLRHAFTHFRLELTAHRGRVLRLEAAGVAEPDDRRWLALDAIDQAPLPTPVLKLLRGLSPGRAGAQNARPSVR